MSNQLIPIHDIDHPIQGAHIGFPKPDRTVDIIITLRPKSIDDNSVENFEDLIFSHPRERTYLTHEELKEVKGFGEEDIQMLVEYINSYDFQIIDDDEAHRKLICQGTIRNFESAFNTKVGIHQSVDQNSFLYHQQPLAVPEDIAHIIYSVEGLHIKPKVESRNQTAPQGQENEDNGWDKGFSVSSIIQAYNFPDDVRGEDQCIGIIELGGKFKDSDIDMFFDLIGVSKPEIVIVGDTPTNNSEVANGEVSMDIQIAGAIAPEAKIVVYYAHTILDALKTIVNDTENCPTVVSISWSATEQYYNAKSRAEFDQVLFEAALLGITVIGSSGDHGSYNNIEYPNVALPSSHPYVLGCGGSIVNIEDGALVGEVVWNEFQGREASGGGYSNYYGMPEYQQYAIANYPFQRERRRGVPDVAGLSSTIDGFQIILDGQKAVVGGTSTATPMWAALFALMNEKLDYQLGFINPFLYSLAGTEAFNQIVKGDNWLYRASAYWSPCTGLGSPNGKMLIELINDHQENDDSQSE